MRPQRIVQFGEFQFDPAAPLLMHGSRSLELSPKALEILAVLIKNTGRVVGKDDLLNLVWPAAIVEEGNLAVHIFALRKALGEDASSARYIETIPKRGYRFAAPVYSLPEAAKGGEQGTGPVPNCRTLPTSVICPVISGSASGRGKRAGRSGVGRGARRLLRTGHGTCPCRRSEGAPRPAKHTNARSLGRHC